MNCMDGRRSGKEARRLGAPRRRRARKGLVAVALVAMTAGAGHLWAAANACRYTVSTDTVQDNVSLLVWQRAVPSSSYTWAEAGSYCQSLNLGGYSSGWRLPAIRELESLVDVRTLNPAIDATAFPSTPSEFFWSGTEYLGQGGFAFAVDFGTGSTDNADGMLNSRRVRCVR